MPNFKIPPPPPPPNFNFTNKTNNEQKKTSPLSKTEGKKNFDKKNKLSEKGKKALFFFLGALCFASSIVMFTLMFVL